MKIGKVTFKGLGQGPNFQGQALEIGP